MNHNKRVFVFLDNIRSVHNTGSIFRTAETLGIDRIYCSGTTPSPTDRFGRKRRDFAKVSLGAEDMVSWEHTTNDVKIIKNLKAKGFKVIALEQAAGSIDYRKIRITNKTIIIVGNEVNGVSKKLLKLSDRVAEIPIQGKKESLNAAVAAGIFLYRIMGA